MSHKADDPKWKIYFDAIQSVLTSGAIIAAAWWFFFQGEANDKAKCFHTLAMVPVDGSATNFLWGDLKVQIENVGKRPLALEEIEYTISQVKPIGTTLKALVDAGFDIVPAGTNNRVNWPILNQAVFPLNKMSILPGEVDNLDYEFSVPANVEVLRIYSWFTADKKKNLGWGKVSIYKVMNDRWVQITESEAPNEK
jgi:hypothetical protein